MRVALFIGLLVAALSLTMPAASVVVPPRPRIVYVMPDNTPRRRRRRRRSGNLYNFTFGRYERSFYSLILPSF
jgi:hypothetical protein